MRIEREREEEVLTLKLSGRLETATSAAFQKVVDFELEEIRELKVDMKEVEYVSSAGLRVLLAAKKKMKAKNGSMTVHNVNEEVMQVFEITGFRNILDIR